VCLAPQTGSHSPTHFSAKETLAFQAETIQTNVARCVNLPSREKPGCALYVGTAREEKATDVPGDCFAIVPKILNSERFPSRPAKHRRLAGWTKGVESVFVVCQPPNGLDIVGLKTSTARVDQEVFQVQGNLGYILIPSTLEDFNG
ncbi:hypothetical protein BaRGS_00025575, partial [Batillaria attramentaria]